jgi:dipeptidase E
MDLLLFSNSKTPDGAYLAHAVEPFRALAAGRRRVAFVPYAGVTISWDDYTEKLRNAFVGLDLEISPTHTAVNPAELIRRSDMILVGGGNTFQLLAECRKHGLLEAIVTRVCEGALYMGWSAGANLACPTICTTNDMPIVDPQGFGALGLVDFQINPHYTNALPAGHQGETRMQRIEELLVANPAMSVLGLPEGDWLEVSGKQVRLHGPHAATVFHNGEAPSTLDSGSMFTTLRKGAA